jgi:hypothetical protein
MLRTLIKFFPCLEFQTTSASKRYRTRSFNTDSSIPLYRPYPTLVSDPSAATITRSAKTQPLGYFAAEPFLAILLPSNLFSLLPSNFSNPFSRNMISIASIQIVRIVQLCFSLLATFLLSLQVNQGMMGFEARYYYTSLGIYCML